MSFSQFFQIHFISLLRLIANIDCPNLEVKSFGLSPSVKGPAEGSNTYLSGNILPQERWLLSFLRTLRKTFCFKVKAETGLRFIHKLGWKNSWQSSKAGKSLIFLLFFLKGQEAYSSLG